MLAQGLRHRGFIEAWVSRSLLFKSLSDRHCRNDEIAESEIAEFIKYFSGWGGGWYRPLFFYRWLVGTKQSKQNLRQSAEFAAVCRIFPRPESQNSIESQKLAVPTVLQKWFMARSLLQCGLGFI